MFFSCKWTPSQFCLIGSGQQGFHHFMVEYKNLDDVGKGYDLLQYNHKNGIAYTLDDIQTIT